MVKVVERLNREHPEGPIFRNTHDKPYSGDGVTMMMFKVRLRLAKRKPPINLPDGLSVYGLRHTFARDGFKTSFTNPKRQRGSPSLALRVSFETASTQFIVQHPDKLEYLRELLGHKDLKMIRKHYGHLFDESAALHGVLADMKTL